MEIVESQPGEMEVNPESNINSFEIVFGLLLNLLFFLSFSSYEGIGFLIKKKKLDWLINTQNTLVI